MPIHGVRTAPHLWGWRNGRSAGRRRTTKRIRVQKNECRDGDPVTRFRVFWILVLFGYSSRVFRVQGFSGSGFQVLEDGRHTRYGAGGMLVNAAAATEGGYSSGGQRSDV